MVQRVYATLTEYEDYIGDTVPEADQPRITRLLRRASGLVDQMTVAAVYRTDDDGYPTDPDVSDAFTEATCAQVAWFEETGNDTGTVEGFAGGSLGSLNLPATTQGAAFSQDAASVLAGVGILRTAVYS